MRRAPLAGLLVLLLAAHARADSAPYKATVVDAEVKLRSGPSDQFPDTGTLRKGSVVVVEKEEGNGWLAVSAYGSVSWVATQFVEDPTPDKAAPKNVFVHAEDEVTLAAGKVGLEQPLDIRRVKIPNGTTLVVLGPKTTFSGKTWYMVQSPPGDVRYLPKTALQFDKPVSNSVAVRVNETVTPLPPGGSPTVAPATPAGGALATMSPGAATITPVTGGVTAGKPAVNHPLWTQAEAAERDNRLADAEKLYFQLAAEMNAQGGDHDIASLCYTRIHMLREKKRNANAANVTPTNGTPASVPSVLRPPAREDRGVRPGTPEPLPSAAPVGGSRERDDRTQMSGTGVLSRSSITPDGLDRKVYRLESAPGVVRMYVTAGDGVDLERYLGKRVDVSGTASTRTGLSKPYVVATTVEPAP